MNFADIDTYDIITSAVFGVLVVIVAGFAVLLTYQEYSRFKSDRRKKPTYFVILCFTTLFGEFTLFSISAISPLFDIPVTSAVFASVGLTFTQISYILYTHARSEAIIQASHWERTIRFGIKTCLITILGCNIVSSMGFVVGFPLNMNLGLLLLSGLIVAGLDVFYTVLFWRYVKANTWNPQKSETMVIARYGMRTASSALAVWVFYLLGQLLGPRWLRLVFFLLSQVCLLAVYVLVARMRVAIAEVQAALKINDNGLASDMLHSSKSTGDDTSTRNDSQLSQA